MSKNIVINFFLFQIGWFACVIGAAKQMPWLGVAVVGAIVIWHLSQAIRPKLEVYLIIITLIVGAIYDQTMLQNNLLTYQAHGWSNSITPVWILALWAEFATILNVSLRWMKDIKSATKWLIALLFGAIGGPLAYIAAARLGAVQLDNLPLSYIGLSLGWAIITPLLLKLSERFDGFRLAEEPKH